MESRSDRLASRWPSRRPRFAADVSYHAETASTAKRQGAINAGERRVAMRRRQVRRDRAVGDAADEPVRRLAREVGPFRVFAQFAPRDVAACNEASERRDRPPAKAPPKAAPGSGQA
jgi:hypothetical protein